MGTPPPETFRLLRIGCRPKRDPARLLGLRWTRSGRPASKNLQMGIQFSRPFHSAGSSRGHGASPSITHGAAWGFGRSEWAPGSSLSSPAGRSTNLRAGAGTNRNGTGLVGCDEIAMGFMARPPPSVGFARASSCIEAETETRPPCIQKRMKYQKKSKRQPKEEWIALASEFKTDPLYQIVSQGNEHILPALQLLKLILCLVPCPVLALLLQHERKIESWELEEWRKRQCGERKS
ncbi:hypothetical protein J3F83DRAFT_721388 [Trichoderma novae-zelandiae]